MKLKKRTNIFFYLISYIIIYIVFLLIGISFLVKQISQNDILFKGIYNIYFNNSILNNYNKDNVANKMKYCSLINTNTFIYKKQFIDYIDLYRYKPKYIFLCPNMKKQSITNGLGMIALIMNNFYKNYNTYNTNHLYHELVHYNFLITLFNNPLKYWELKTQTLKIYKRLDSFCNKHKDLTFKKYNINTYTSINLECSNIKFIKTHYTEDNDYGKAEELIAYQTSFKKVDKNRKLKYLFDINNIDNKELKDILFDMNKIYKNYILK